MKKRITSEEFEKLFIKYSEEVKNLLITKHMKKNDAKNLMKKEHNLPFIHFDRIMKRLGLRGRSIPKLEVEKPTKPKKKKQKK